MTILCITRPPVKPYFKRQSPARPFGEGILPVAAPAPRRRTITIKGIAYRVEPIDPGEDATAAFRLSKMSGDGAIYDVVRTWYGTIECDCADYTYRRKGLTATPCKHGAALVAAGLIDPPSPGPDHYPDEAPAADEGAFHSPEDAVTPTPFGRKPYTQSDLDWWARVSNRSPRDYDPLAAAVRRLELASEPHDHRGELLGHDS